MENVIKKITKSINRFMAGCICTKGVRTRLIRACDEIMSLRGQVATLTNEKVDLMNSWVDAAARWKHDVDSLQNLLNEARAQLGSMQEAIDVALFSMACAEGGTCCRALLTVASEDGKKAYLDEIIRSKRCDCAADLPPEYPR